LHFFASLFVNVIRRVNANTHRLNPIRIVAVWITNRWLRRNLDFKTFGEKIYPSDKPSISFVACDSQVMEAVFWFGARGYEGKLPEIWELLCLQASKVVEIGGNVGFYSVLGGRRAKGGYSVYEPIPMIADALATNLAENSLQSIVSLRREAVVPVAEVSSINLVLPVEQRAIPVGAFLAEYAEGIDRDASQTIKVAACYIGSAIEGADLIKLDTEGIELQLLEKVYPSIVRDAPSIVIEVLGGSLGLLSLLRKLCSEVPYRIWVAPEYGYSSCFELTLEQLTMQTLKQLNAKDVIFVSPKFSDNNVHGFKLQSF
jgi:FkbM family methyltransferase